jgi:hypothetical protein
MTEDSMSKSEIAKNMVTVLESSWLPVMQQAIIKLTGLPEEFFNEVVDDWHKYPNPSGLPHNLKGMYQLIGAVACAKQYLELCRNISLLKTNVNDYNNVMESLNKMFKILGPLLAEMFRHENIAIPQLITNAKEESAANVGKERTKKANEKIADKTEKKREMIVALYKSMKEKDPNIKKDQAALDISKMKGVGLGHRRVRFYIPKG